MIPALAILAILFFPGFSGNAMLGKLIVAAALLIFHRPIYPMRPRLIQGLLVAWLLWAMVGCIFSEYGIVAFHGFHLRMEGFFTLALLTFLGWAYWTRFDTTQPLALLLFASCIGLISCKAFMTDLMFRSWIMPDVAMAGFGAMAAVFMFAESPAMFLIGLVPAVMAQNRSALVGIVVGLMVKAWFTPAVRRHWKLVIAALVIVLAGVVAQPGYRAKFTKLNCFTLGHGSRAQWVKETATLAFDKPVLGLGLDTLGYHLQVGQNKGADVVAYADKTHNIACDILLQTGFVGLFLACWCFAAAFWVTRDCPSMRNVACFAGLCAWVAFGFINPQGIPAHMLMMLCVFGFETGDAQS